MVLKGGSMRGIELFAGAGGLGLGLSKAGFEPEQVVELNHWCCETLRDNIARKISKPHFMADTRTM